MTLRQICAGRKTMYMSFVLIPLSVFLIAGENTDGDYFEKGRFVTNTEGWEYSYRGAVHTYGLMVSHYSAIVIVSIVGMLISWVVYEGVLAYKKEKSK